MCRGRLLIKIAGIKPPVRKLGSLIALEDDKGPGNK